MKNEASVPLEGRRILIAISGSIAAVKTPLLISSLIKAGAEVRCLVTPSAANLVSPLSLATLSRHRCYQNEDQWDPNEPRPLHIALAEWAEMVVIAPLSATSLSRWTQGSGEGLLASLLLALEKPVLAVPAMNTAMWSSPYVKSNWTKIQNDPRVLTLPPSPGLLACDRIGDGRMVEPGLIQLAIASGLMQQSKNGFLKKDWTGKQLLATAGPTCEAIDAARLFTNRSSGRMGVLMAQAARLRGAEVDLVHGQLQLPSAWLEGLNSHSVSNSEDMQKVLTQLQPKADAVVMAAAIADLRIKASKSSDKLSKESLLASMGSAFEPVPDLLTELARQRHPGQLLLGFAALTGDDEEIQKRGKAKKTHKGCDLLLANAIDRPGQGFSENPNGGWLFGPGEKVRYLPVTSKLTLAHQLLDALLELKKESSLEK